LRHHLPFDFFEQALAGSHIAAANEKGGAFKILRSARKNGAVHEVAHLLNRHASVAKYFIRARVNRDHAIKDARLRITIDLNEDLAFFHCVCPAR